MRTTLEIDDDVLSAARRLAQVQDASLGKVISDLARAGLRPAPAELDEVNGFPVIRTRGQTITSETVRRGLDDES